MSTPSLEKFEQGLQGRALVMQMGEQQTQGMPAQLPCPSILSARSQLEGLAPAFLCLSSFSSPQNLFAAKESVSPGSSLCEVPWPEKGQGLGPSRQ